MTPAHDPVRAVLARRGYRRPVVIERTSLGELPPGHVVLRSWCLPAERRGR